MFLSLKFYQLIRVNIRLRNGVFYFMIMNKLGNEIDIEL